MKNKTPQKNTGFKNSLYLGIFIIIILAAAISMIAVNVYRYVAPYKSDSNVSQEETYVRDTIYLPSPSKEIIVHDTVWRTRPINKVKPQEVKDSL
jgi:hypothetical protein